VTKKKNLKFKVGDRVRIVSKPTYGPKSDPTDSSVPKVGELYYIVHSYNDGDYDLGTKDTEQYDQDTFGGVVHQRHLERVIDDPGDAVETFRRGFSNHIHIAPQPLGIGDIVKLKDSVTHPYFTGDSGARFDKSSSRIKPGVEYRIGSVTEGKHCVRVRLALNEQIFTYIASVNADQVKRVRTASQERMRQALQTAAARIRDLYGIRTEEPVSARQYLDAETKAETPAPPAVAPVKPRKLTWHDVQLGDEVTAVTRITLSGSRDVSELRHREVVHRADRSNRDGMQGDLYWKDLNLTVHRNYDSWTITDIVKAKDIPKPEPKPLEERRKPARIKITRTVPDNGLWIKHEILTGQRLGVIERRTVHGVEDYWVIWGDGKWGGVHPSLKLTQGVDKVAVEGLALDFDLAEEATHHPA
jgi:hypothetical protein